MLDQLQFNQILRHLRKWASACLLALTVALVSCEENEPVRVFEASFDGSNAGLPAINASAEVQVRFSIPTLQEATVTVELTGLGVDYGDQFTTNPAASNGLISITVPAGSESASFTVTRLVEFIETGYSIDFELMSIAGEEDPHFVGNTIFSVAFEEVISTSGIIDLATGGSTQPNQSYIDFSTGTQTSVRRDTWELGFYNGNENRVFLNSSLLVTAAELPGVTDLNSVSSTMQLDEPLILYYYPDFATKTEVQINTVSDLTSGLPVGYTQYGDAENGIVFTDLASGNLDETAIAEVSTTESENSVYIVSLGSSIPETDAEPGSINATGDHRGFMKIRILSDGSTYTVQYADLDATSFETATITKDESTNLTAFSIVNGTEVDVEPQNWDINFSGVFSFHSGGFGLTYSDYGLHNTLGGAGLYRLTSEEIPGGFGAPATPPNTTIAYDDFTLADVDENEFVTDNRTVIGSGWRSTSQGIAYDFLYFILIDASGNYYKLQFTALLSSGGERGYSQLRYELLQ